MTNSACCLLINAVESWALNVKSRFVPSIGLHLCLSSLCSILGMRRFFCNASAEILRRLRRVSSLNHLHRTVAGASLFSLAATSAHLIVPLGKKNEASDKILKFVPDVELPSEVNLYVKLICSMFLSISFTNSLLLRLMVRPSWHLEISLTVWLALDHLLVLNATWLTLAWQNSFLPRHLVFPQVVVTCFTLLIEVDWFLVQNTSFYYQY